MDLGGGTGWNMMGNTAPVSWLSTWFREKFIGWRAL